MKKYYLCLIAGLLGCLLVSLPLAAEENYGNFSSEEELMGITSLESIDLPFDPNDYSFLIYVPIGGEDSIERAMDKLGISYDRRDKDNIVTANDLATHDILIVGWNYQGNTDGLDENILEAGITGRIILSGHDLDYHTAPPPSNPEGYREAAEIMFIQAIDFILQGSGTGMITLGDIPKFGFPFSYIPTFWGINAVTAVGQTTEEFTFEGLDSGVYDNLTPQQMYGWNTSYHDTFTIDPNSSFVPFELGLGGMDDIITVARINSFGLSLEIVDGLEPETCVVPTDEITYTITWSRPVGAPGDPGPLTIVDYLPPEVDYPLALQDPNYDILTHTYTWTVDGLDPGDSVTKYLTVEVNELAEPLGVLINRVAIYNSEGLLITMLEATPVCCWGGDVIFVDNTATGANTGTCWRDAYVDLQDALERAGAGCGDEIWVAQGVYVPGDAVDDTFNLITGVAVYGGFRGEETLLSQRDPVHHKSILSGNDTCDNVVKADDVDTTAIFDGFTVCAAAQDGVACTDGAEPVITACIIETNGDSGVYINASSPTLNQCLIKNNDGDGLEIIGSSSSAITHCIIDNNGAQGIYTGSAAPAIGNCFIKNNGGNGVSTANPATAPIMYNVTLTLNDGMAIYQPGGAAANAYNCILWENNNNGVQYWGCDLTYSCYYDPVNPPSGMPDPNSNITANPSFVYDDAANGHLRDDSPCIDLGCSYTGCTSDVDLDGDDRVIDITGKGDGTVDIDMGCDEFVCEDLEHEWDFNQDSIINLLEFAPFAAAWLKDSNDPNWINTYSRCDFYEDQNDIVDVLDFCAFAEVWLWQACWRDGGGMMMMAIGGGGDCLLALPTTPSSAELETAKLARWRELQPAFEPTGQNLLWQIEDIIYWLEKLWATDPDFRKDITEADFAEFLKHLYAERDALMDELAAQNEVAP